MRYRRLPEGPGASDRYEEQAKQQRVSTKLVALLSVIVLLALVWFSEWNEKPPQTVDDLRKDDDNELGGKWTSTPERKSSNDEEVGQTRAGEGKDTGVRQNNSIGAEDDDDENERTDIPLGPSPATRRRPVCPRTATQAILLFPHVNKAGGRTIEGTFDSLTNPRPQFSPLSRERRSRRFKFTLIDGHRDYDEIKALVDSTETRSQCIRWIFMLRDPVARTLSAFNTMVGRSEPAFSKLFDHFYCDSPMIQNLMKDANFTIEDFANLPAKERDTCQRNYHVRYLAGKGMNLERAKRRLMRMAFVGIAEEFSLSMQLLNWELDLDLELFTPVFNKNPYAKEEALSPKALQVLQEMNCLDIQLYEFSKTNFYKPRLEAMQRFYGGSLPWKEKPAVCDPTIICWDKRMRFTNKTWGFDEEPPEEARLADPGLRKQNMLCGPAKGCVLSQPELREIPKANLNNTPPELPRKSESLCMASIFIVGTRKGGTTSLYQYFVEHPNFRGILLNRGAQSGETFFFEMRSFPVGDDRQQPPAKLREMYDVVYSHEFRRMGLAERIDPRYHLTGESSVGMGPSCYSPRVLKETCGSKLKVIYLLRNPVDRMLSQYQMRARLKVVDVEANFTAYAQKELRTIKSHPLYRDLIEWAQLSDILSAPPPCLFPHDFHNALWSGLYLVHLARWYRQFDARNILVLQSEDFFKNPKKTFVQSLQFAQLDVNLVDAEAITKQVFNAAPRSKDDEDEEQRKVLNDLAEFFRPWNTALFKWLKNRNIEIDPKLWEE